MNEHWLNKILPGKGTLKDFCADYEKINAGDNQFATASQLFPTAKLRGNSEDQEIIFEYVIYYKVNPNALQQQPAQPQEMIL